MVPTLVDIPAQIREQALIPKESFAITIGASKTEQTSALRLAAGSLATGRLQKMRICSEYIDGYSLLQIFICRRSQIV